MTDRVTAGVLYLILAGFALAVLMILLLTPPPKSWEILVSVPEALFLLVTLASLALGSVAMALIFFRRRPQVYLRGRVLKALVLALPILALSWAPAASVFWLLPVFFAWRAANALQS
jgi:hypothetical protein